MFRVIIVLALALAAQPEPPSDPIGDLLDQAARPGPPAAGASPAVPQIGPAAATPDNAADEDEGSPPQAGPRPYADLPPTAPARAPSRLFATPFISLPRKPQGPLDGGWVLARADGGQGLYQFQFNDTGGPDIEGAWRDLRRADAATGSGPLDSVSNDPAALVIRFRERGAPALPAAATLHPSGAGGWSGLLTLGDQVVPVVMKRY